MNKEKMQAIERFGRLYQAIINYNPDFKRDPILNALKESIKFVDIEPIKIWNKSLTSKLKELKNG